MQNNEQNVQLQANLENIQVKFDMMNIFYVGIMLAAGISIFNTISSLVAAILTRLFL